MACATTWRPKHIPRTGSPASSAERGNASSFPTHSQPELTKDGEPVITAKSEDLSSAAEGMQPAYALFIAMSLTPMLARCLDIANPSFVPLSLSESQLSTSALILRSLTLQINNLRTQVARTLRINK